MRTGLLGKWPQLIVAQYSDGVVSNTHAGFVTSGVHKIQGLRMWVLPNAVSAEPAKPISLPDALPKRLVLVMLGNIKIQHKGYDIAAQLAGALRDTGMDFELRIAGRPDELEEMEELFRQLGVQSVIKFYGEVSQPEEFLREGHLYLLLSRFEGMPNTLLEALSVGLPAIATEVGDLKAYKERGAPFTLIPAENIQIATTAVLRAARNWAETRRSGIYGRQWVQNNFSEDACRSALRRLLAEVMM